MRLGNYVFCFQMETRKLHFLKIIFLEMLHAAEK